MQIMRIRTRFDPNVQVNQLFGGYRDLALKVKMGFACSQTNCAGDWVKFVPVSRWRESNVKRLIFEIQLYLVQMQLDGLHAGADVHHDTNVASRNLLSV